MDRVEGMRRKSMSPPKDKKKAMKEGTYDVEGVEMTGLLRTSPNRSAKGKNQSLLASYNGRRQLGVTTLVVFLVLSGVFLFDSHRKSLLSYIRA